MIFKELIFLDMDLKNQEEIFNFIADKGYNLKLINDTEGYKNALKLREEEISTSVGFNIAIPHCRNKAVNEPFISFVKLKNGILWGNENVSMIFIIGVPDTEGCNNLHLKYLSSISKLLIHEDFREELLRSNDIEHIYKMLKRAEGGSRI